MSRLLGKNILPDRLGSWVWETKKAVNIQINGDIWNTNKSTGLQKKR